MDLKENDIYTIPKKRFRRILGILDDYVFYSKGGDTNGACQVKTFIRWIKDNGAVQEEIQKRENRLP